jgi:hypothetical protein
MQYLSQRVAGTSLANFRLLKAYVQILYSGISHTSSFHITSIQRHTGLRETLFLQRHLRANNDLQGEQISESSWGAPPPPTRSFLRQPPRQTQCFKMRAQSNRNGLLKVGKPSIPSEFPPLLIDLGESLQRLPTSYLRRDGSSYLETRALPLADLFLLQGEMERWFFTGSIRHVELRQTESAPT